MQQYLLSEEAQSQIEATGRRISANGVSDENRDVFKEEWGIDTERILSPIQMPDSDVLMEALNLYQTSFKKPPSNIYCWISSGSMEGPGRRSSKTPCPRSCCRRMPTKISCRRMRGRSTR